MKQSDQWVGDKFKSGRDNARLTEASDNIYEKWFNCNIRIQ